MSAERDQSAGAFAGWCILELMGHRKLGGYVQEATIGGAAFIRIDVPSDCNGGVSAVWCPEHGECACKDRDDLNDPTCPLHSATSRHGEEGSAVRATQFYAPAAVYCITPCTEDTARSLARSARPAPVQRYELLPAPTRTVTAEEGEAARINEEMPF